MKNNGKKSQISFRSLGVVLVFFLVVLSACSDKRTGLGNSAESGNPEIAGVLKLSDGSYASKAVVRCVPQAYSVISGDKLDPEYVSKTDSLGRYSFAEAPEGDFSIEASDSLTGELFIAQHLRKSEDSSFVQNGKLSPAGKIRLGAHGFADGTKGVVYVPGTTILRKVQVRLGNIFVDSLPADSLYPLIFNSDDGYTLSLEKGVNVVSDSIVSVDASKISLAFRIPLDTKSSGMNLTEDLTAFPLAISLDSSDFDFEGLRNISGAWIAVYDGDTIPLELSYWNLDLKKASFWVKLPKLLSQTEDSLFLYFEEAGKLANSSVFDRGFIAVWHFDEGPDSIYDATENGFDGKPTDLIDADDAAVGGALYYSGNKNSGYIEIPNSASGVLNFGFRDTLTISVWVRLDSYDVSRVVYGKGATQFHLMYLHNSGWLFEDFSEEALTDSSLASRYWYVSSIDSSDDAGVWTFIVISQNDTALNMYVDDSLAASSPSIGTSSEGRSEDSLFTIGRLVYPAEDPTDVVTHYFDGVIDELHVSYEARSAAWIHAMYVNQNPRKRWPVPKLIQGYL